MSVEQGFVNVINASLASSLPGVTGGFAVQLPENFVSKSNPMSWTYRSILSQPIYSLSGENALTNWEVQIDCIGYTMFHAITLSNAIVSALSGIWNGTMTDTNNTVCQGIFRQPSFVDGYNDASRTYIRSLEYEIHYLAS